MIRCGLCGSNNISSQTSSPDRCLNCGAMEAFGEWYIDDKASPSNDSIRQKSGFYKLYKENKQYVRC